MRRPFRWIRLAPLCLAVAIAAVGAAAGPGARAKESGERAAVALLPLENLTGRSELGERFSRLVWAALGGDDRLRVVDVGEVESAIGEVRIRNAGLVSREQVQRLARRLGVRWIYAGTLLECGSIRTPDGDVPTFGMTLRVLDGRSGEVVWADMRARSGEDRETIFGWGRESSLDRLAESTARDLVKHVKLPASRDSASSSEVSP